MNRFTFFTNASEMSMVAKDQKTNRLIDISFKKIIGVSEDTFDRVEFKLNPFEKRFCGMVSRSTGRFLDPRGSWDQLELVGELESILTTARTAMVEATKKAARRAEVV